MSGKSAGIFLLGIIALGGLGLSVFSIMNFQVVEGPQGPPGQDGTNNSGLILVGLWDDLDDNTYYFPHDSNDNWLMEFNNSPLNDSSYVSVSNNNTRFILLKTGFYKITLTILLQSVAANEIYIVYLLRNSIHDNVFERVAISAFPSDYLYQVQSSLYVYSNGVDYFTINCYSSGDDFFITGSNDFNQFSIEYVL